MALHQRPFRVAHPAGTFIVIFAWSDRAIEGATVNTVLTELYGTSSRIEEMTENDLFESPSAEGRPIIMATAF